MCKEKFLKKGVFSGAEKNVFSNGKDQRFTAVLAQIHFLKSNICRPIVKFQNTRPKGQQTFCYGSESKYLRFCRPHSPCHIYSILLFQQNSSQRQYVSEWASLDSNRTSGAEQLGGLLTPDQKQRKCQKQRNEKNEQKWKTSK